MIILRVPGECDVRLPSTEVAELNTHLDRHVFEVRFAGRSSHTRIRPRYRRIFRGDLTQHGRWYAAAQDMTKAERRTILMDGSPTVELDVCSCQMRVVLNSRGLAAPRDAYAIPGVPANQRAKYKQAMIIALNAESYDSAEFALRGWLAERGLNPNQAPRVFARVVDAYPELAEVWFSGSSGWAMRLDSEVCAGVFRWAVREDVPCLGVHDAWLVPTWAEADLYRAICEAYSEVVGGFEPVLKRTAADGTEEYVDYDYYGETR